MTGSGKYIFISLLLLYINVSSVFAQEILINDTISKDVLYYKNRSYGVMATNRGYGLCGSFGKNTSAFRTVSWDFGIETLNHPKEVTNSENLAYISGASSFKYGKINHIFILSAHRSVSRLITDSPYWGGIESRYYYSAGLNIALAKPIYYNVIVDYIPLGNQLQIETEIMKFNENISSYDIVGPMGYFKGFNELIPYPGITLNGGFSFDFSSSRQTIRKLVLGASIDFYPIPLPIMDQYNSEYIIPKFKITYMFGSNFNR